MKCTKLFNKHFILRFKTASNHSRQSKCQFFCIILSYSLFFDQINKFFQIICILKTFKVFFLLIGFRLWEIRLKLFKFKNKIYSIEIRESCIFNWCFINFLYTSPESPVFMRVEKNLFCICVNANFFKSTDQNWNRK